MDDIPIFNLDEADVTPDALDSETGAIVKVDVEKASWFERVKHSLAGAIAGINHWFADHTQLSIAIVVGLVAIIVVILHLTSGKKEVTTPCQLLTLNQFLDEMDDTITDACKYICGDPNAHDECQGELCETYGKQALDHLQKTNPKYAGQDWPETTGGSCFGICKLWARQGVLTNGSLMKPTDQHTFDDPNYITIFQHMKGNEPPFQPGGTTVNGKDGESKLVDFIRFCPNDAHLIADQFKEVINVCFRSSLLQNNSKDGVAPSFGGITLGPSRISGFGLELEGTLSKGTNMTDPRKEHGRIIDVSKLKDNWNAKDGIWYGYASRGLADGYFCWFMPRSEDHSTLEHRKTIIDRNPMSSHLDDWPPARVDNPDMSVGDIFQISIQVVFWIIILLIILYHFGFIG